MQDQNSLQKAYSKYRSAFAATLIFSMFTNLLMFVGPLYMLQIYDRVLSSRNSTTLIALTVISVSLLLAYGLLEFTRSKLLVRAGLQFDEVLAHPTFHLVVKQQTALPGSGAGNTGAAAMGFPSTSRMMSQIWKITLIHCT